MSILHTIETRIIIRKTLKSEKFVNKNVDISDAHLEIKFKYLSL